MESKDIEQKVNRLEKKQEELEMFVNKSISSIQVGIVEIKTLPIASFANVVIICVFSDSFIIIF